ncbi:MAG: DUF4437 domain-containing protein [Deltaproteobacteria bacterium]|nr:DUF4437 domain-containing protein [Deltaproteobacteria bacterium]NNK07803.1 DUF4437 domain-containing protein [Myxococcales bacterium]MBT8465373.1 DUF4437 domain-containing protein [Deltaproteobacteria bacterium]MBT8480303.1 DUF4437 domain-containing protein [Deltaproteobacteria bacterium]NNK44260.1 DUF4437 domain-containing protein [Myxococcales bacterium]
MKTFPLPVFVLVGTACASSQVAPQAAEPAAAMVLASDVEWEQLNPARGDQSPKAAALWGDRTGRGPSGFLVRFVDGFSSPPHIHNVSYRGMVIEGLIHNDDPNAEAMWMPTGSFWTQPRGGAHITAARGTDTLAYIEIEEGPYLVRPVEEAFQVEERRVNVDTSNIVWVSASEITGSAPIDAPTPANEPKIAFLWGNPEDEGPSGILVKLRAGSAGVLRSNRSTYRAVVIQGSPAHHAVDGSDPTIMGPGSYIGSHGASPRVSCESREDCILYVRMED